MAHFLNEFYITGRAICKTKSKKQTTKLSDQKIK